MNVWLTLPVLPMHWTISSESPSCLTESWLLQTPLQKCTNVVKKYVNIHAEVKTLWSWLIWQNCCQKHFWGHKTTSKTSVGQGAQGMCYRAVRMKSFEMTNQNSKSLDQVGGSMFDEELVKELCFLYHANHKTGGWSVMVLLFLPITKSGIWNQVKDKLKKSGNHSILHYHVVLSGIRLVSPGILLITQSILVNSTRGTKKVKKKQYILYLMFWPVQLADLDPIELVCDEHELKVRTKQAKSAPQLRKIFQKS